MPTPIPQWLNKKHFGTKSTVPGLTGRRSEGGRGRRGGGGCCGTPENVFATFQESRLPVSWGLESTRHVRLSGETFTSDFLAYGQLLN